MNEVASAEGMEPAAEDSGGVGDSAGAGGLADHVSGVEAPEPVAQPGIPEKFLKDGQVNVDALTKSYMELEKRLGAGEQKSQAPEQYELNVPEDYPIPEGDPLYTAFESAARQMGLSQEMHDAIVSAFIEAAPNAQQAQMDAWQEHLNEEFKLLGPDADKRIKAIEGFARLNLPENLAERVNGWLTSVEDVRAVEALMQKTRDMRLPRRVDAMASTVDADKLREMRSAKTDNGQLRMSVDPEYKRMVERAYEEFYGNEPAQTIVSGLR